MFGFRIDPILDDTNGQPLLHQLPCRVKLEGVHERVDADIGESEHQRPIVEIAAVCEVKHSHNEVDLIGRPAGRKRHCDHDESLDDVALASIHLILYHSYSIELGKTN